MTFPDPKQVKMILTREGLQRAIDATGIEITTLAKGATVDRGTLHRYLRGAHSLSSAKLRAVWEVVLKERK